MFLNIIVQIAIQLIAILRDAHLIGTSLSSVEFVIYTTTIMGFISATFLDWAVVMNFSINRKITVISIFIAIALVIIKKPDIIDNNIRLSLFLVVLALVNLIIYSSYTAHFGLLPKRITSFASVAMVNTAVFFENFNIAWLNTLAFANFMPIFIYYFIKISRVPQETTGRKLSFSIPMLALKSAVIWICLAFILWKSASIVDSFDALSLRIFSYQMSAVIVHVPLLWKFGWNFYVLLLDFLIASLTVVYHSYLIYFGYFEVIESVQYILVTLFFILSYTKLLKKFGVA